MSHSRGPVAPSGQNGQLEDMSKHAVELLTRFRGAPSDKQAFAVEVLRRTRELPFDSGSLSDEEIGEA